MAVNPYDGAGYGCGIGYGYCGTPAAGSALLLDSVTAYAAWSLRKLSSVHTYAIRVRRSSDNAEQDIGFVNNSLDTASLLTFCGAGSGYIVTKYDATGNGRHWTQATTTLQTRIVNSGVVESIDGYSAERFVSGTLMHTSNESLVSARLDLFGLWAVTGEDSFSIGFSNATGTTYAVTMQQGVLASDVVSGGGSPTFAKNGSPVSLATRDDAYTTFVTGEVLIVRMQSLNTSTWTSGTRDGYPNSGANFNGRRLEEIWFNSDATASAAVIEANQADFYGVTLA